MPTDSTTTPSVIADYRIVRLLAEGNHGTFYLAQAPARLALKQSDVVLKVFHAEITEDAYRRGVRELRAFAAVKSLGVKLIRWPGGSASDTYHWQTNTECASGYVAPITPLHRL